MNNKKIGTDFEQEIVEKLASMGYWAHFIVPDARGAQPFDIIAVKDMIAYAIDCKTCKANTFSISRLEANQITSFELWLRCRNTVPFIVIKHNEQIYVVKYDLLKEVKRIRLNDEYRV